MAYFKEIVTKAVIGKGKKTTKEKHEVSINNAIDNVLGCWVINHNFAGSIINNNVEVTGSYDVNIWYSYDNDTKTTVITKKITYSESVMIRQRELSDSTVKDIIVRSLKQPSCIQAKEDGKTIIIEIEKELGIEIVGDTKVRVAIEEDEEQWDIIDDDAVTEEDLKEIDKSVDNDYLKNTIKEENKK